MAAFLDGALRPRLTALVGALAITGMLIFAGSRWITLKTLARYPGYFAENNRDEYVFLTAAAYRLSHVSEKAVEVILIGDSSLREAISDPALIETQLSYQLAQPVRVHLLAAGGLSEWDIVALTDCIPPNIHGVLCIETAPYHLAQPRLKLDDAEASRVLIDSRHLFLERLASGYSQPHRTGNYLVDHAPFFLARLASLQHLVTGPVVYKQHLLDDARAWDDQEWERQGPRVIDWESKYHRSSQGNLKVFRHVLTHAKQTNPQLSLALIESVENPRVAWQWKTDSHRNARAEFQADVHELADQFSSPLWDIAGEVSLQPGEFIDYTHLRAADARKRYTEALARHLTELLQGQPISLPAGAHDSAATQPSGRRGRAHHGA